MRVEARDLDDAKSEQRITYCGVWNIYSLCDQVSLDDAQSLNNPVAAVQVSNGWINQQAPCCLFFFSSNSLTWISVFGALAAWLTTSSNS